MRIGWPSTVCSVVYRPRGVELAPIDLRRVRVVGGDDDQRVRVRALELVGDADRVVHADQLADLAAGVGGVVALVDRGALDLQHEALRVALSSLMALSVISARWARCRGSDGWHFVVAEPAPVSDAISGGVLRRHVRVVEQAEQPLAGGERRDAVQVGLGGDVLVALSCDRVVDDVLRATGRRAAARSGRGRRPARRRTGCRPAARRSSRAAGGLGLRRARGARVVRAVAAALGDVRDGPAGVASVISAVETLPVDRPRSLARSPCRSRSSCPGRSRPCSGPGPGARRAS